MFFVVFEGENGVGKTTLMRETRKQLQALGYSVFATHEPGGSESCKDLRHVLFNTTLIPQAQLLVFLADRVQHIHDTLIPAGVSNDIVLCDRYHLSTLRFQVDQAGLSFETVKQFFDATARFRGRLVLPDLNILVEAPVDDVMGRLIASREALNFEPHEKVNILQGIAAYRQAADAYADKSPYLLVNNLEGELEKTAASLAGDIIGFGRAKGYLEASEDLQ